MFRKIVSLVLVFLSFAISEAVFAGTIPFPQKIDPTANTVTPGKIYKVNGSSYLVENKDGKIELTQLRDIGNLTTQLRTTVIYNSDGTFSSGNDAMNQPIAVTTLSAPADTPIGNPSHADAVAVAATAGIAATPPASADTSNGITVIVTEKIPGADCVEIPDSGSGVTTRKYKCTVKS